MANWFYYAADGRKFGPVSAEQLKSLVESGAIMPDTLIESETGQQAYAEHTRGLFAEPATKKMEPPMPAPPVAGMVPPSPPAVNMMGTYPPVPPPLPPEAQNKPSPVIQEKSGDNFLSKWNFGTRIIVASAVFAVISFVMPWRSLGPLSVNAFQNGAFLLGLLFAYPVWAAVSGRAVNRVGGLVCGGVGLLLGILFIADSQITFFGETMNAAGSSVYVFLISCVVMGVGVFLHNTAENAEISPTDGHSKLPRPIIASGIGLALIVVIIAACGYFFTGDGSGDSPFSADFAEEEESVDEITTKKLSPQEEIKHLEKKKANAERTNGFIVENPKFYFASRFEGLPKEGVIAIDIRNKTRETISGFSLDGKLVSPGRSVPWMEDDISYKIAGGLEPGESKSLALSAGYGWDNVPKDRNDYVLQVTVKSIQFADDEKVEAGIFTKEDEQKLRELKRK